MTTSSRTLALALAAAVLCGAPRAAAQGHSHGGHTQAPAPARADSVQRPWTAAEVHLMTHMIGNHAQAVDMARLAPTRGANPAVRRLAERIINAQQDEIATMQQWLRDRMQPVPEARASATMTMRMNGVEHQMKMPGMLTDAQMKQLEEARGAEFDRLFLTFMIQHHRGAVAMVEELFATNGAGQDETVFRFATDVNVDQVTEIARMRQMLVAILFEGGTP